MYAIRSYYGRGEGTDRRGDASPVITSYSIHYTKLYEKGTRLLPATKYTPKPLIRVAGRPVLDYVVDKLAGLDVEELIFITGHLKA